MPHLAPLSWMMASLIFWLILLMFISSIWWFQTPNFQTSSKMSSMTFSKWDWS